MPVYRCFFISTRKEITSVAVAELADDGAAYDWGAELLIEQPTHMVCEVWTAARIISRHSQPPGPIIEPATARLSASRSS
jgi:hypothetical protein